MLRGMSGGERKRLAIACGVVAGPSLVFLDEPTSGLDSFAALNVVLFLKSMATERGASLLASLHQPRAAIWTQLDQVCWKEACLWPVGLGQVALHARQCVGGVCQEGGKATQQEVLWQGISAALWVFDVCHINTPADVWYTCVAYTIPSCMSCRLRCLLVVG